MDSKLVNQRKLRSPAWKYFAPSIDRKSASCQICSNNTKISTPSGSTSSLTRHLQTVHSIILNASQKRSNTNDYEGEIDALELIARLAASDGLPFSTIATSVSMRLLFQYSKCCGIPKSGNGIREMMNKFYQAKKLEAVDYFGAATASGRKFSISLDEWTSTANRRYMNINVHSGNGQFVNLGLVRLRGSVTSVACEDYIKLKLADFGLSLDKDIICIITDGAAVMKKLGRIAGKYQQLCLAHGLHLAVMEVIYKQEEAEDLDESEEESQEAASDDEDDTSDGSSSFDIEISANFTELDGNIGDIVKKVRRIVKIFTQSSKNEETLKGYVKMTYPVSDISLLLDVRTRWNSLYLMLDRFVLLRNEVQKALIDLNEPLPVTEAEYEYIEELVRILKPVKCVVEAICKQSANLVSCDVALDMMMKEIRKRDTVLSKKIYQALRTRIIERRSELADVLKYLSPRSKMSWPSRSHPSTSSDLDYFHPLPKTKLQKLIIDLAGILYADESTNGPKISLGMDSDDLSNSVGEITESLDFEVELYNAINLAHESNPSLDPDKSVSGTVKKEMSLWENTGSKGIILSEVYNMLMTIPPTSVEPERVFSSAGYLCSKIRSRLGDATLDALVFLRSYFRSN